MAAEPDRVARSLYADPMIGVWTLLPFSPTSLTASTDKVSLVDIPVIPRDLGDHVYAYGYVPVVVGYVRGPGARTVITFSGDLQPLESPLVVYFSTKDFHERAQVNMSVLALTGDYEPPPKPWHGALVVMKATGDPIVDFCDIEVTDLEIIRTYFGTK